MTSLTRNLLAAAAFAASAMTPSGTGATALPRAGHGLNPILPKRPAARTRSKGKAGAPGSKLARKAAKGKIGIR